MGREALISGCFRDRMLLAQGSAPSATTRLSILLKHAACGGRAHRVPTDGDGGVLDFRLSPRVSQCAGMQRSARRAVSRRVSTSVESRTTNGHAAVPILRAFAVRSCLGLRKNWGQCGEASELK